MILALDKTGRLTTAKRKRSEPNKTEQRFSEYLDLLVKVGELRSRSKFEPERIELARGTTDGRAWRIVYTPDYSAVRKDGVTCFYDVKGTSLYARKSEGQRKRKIPAPYVKEAAMVRIRCAAAKYPACVFCIVFEVDGRWVMQEIRGR